MNDFPRLESYVMEQLIEILINHGADITAHNNDGATPCDVAKERRWSLEDYGYAREDILKLLCE